MLTRHAGGCRLERRVSRRFRRGDSSFELLDVDVAQDAGDPKPDRVVVELEHLPDGVVWVPSINDDSICGDVEPGSVVTFPTMNEDGPLFRVLNHPEEWHEIIFLWIPRPRWNPDVPQFRSGQEFSVIMIMSKVDDCPDPSILQIAESLSSGLRATP